MLPTRRGSSPQSPDHRSDAHPTEPPKPAKLLVQPDKGKTEVISTFAPRYTLWLPTGIALSRHRDYFKWHMRPTYPQTRLRICASAQFDLSLHWSLTWYMSLKHSMANSVDSYQNARMRRLICIYAGRIYYQFSCVCAWVCVWRRSFIFVLLLFVVVVFALLLLLFFKTVLVNRRHHSSNHRLEYSCINTWKISSPKSEKETKSSFEQQKSTIRFIWHVFLVTW